MTIEIIPAEAERLLDWIELAEALKAGHRLPRAQIGDTFLTREPDTLLSRAAWIDGFGSLVKTATVFPGNPAEGLATVNGSATLYDDRHGLAEALVDFHLLTKWKTAADSLLAARLLAKPGASCILIVGAGTVAYALREAYGAAFPGARFQVWNRSPRGSEAMAAHYPDTVVATDLESAVRGADIVTCATSARQPLILGEWLHPGQHVDLIGAFRSDMREADDTALKRSRIFLDSRETVLDHIGELKIPLEQGVLSRDDIVGDFYDIEAGVFRREADDITLFKNGGGAHLDLMSAQYIMRKWRAR